MFRFVVRYLAFLKPIPLMPLLWDAMMMLWIRVTNKALMNSLDRVESTVAEWEGVSIALHRYGGRQFNYLHHEIGHMHSNGVVDILFGRQTKRNLILLGQVEDHHTFPDSGWVSITIRDDESEQRAMTLLRLRKDALTRKFGGMNRQS